MEPGFERIELRFETPMLVVYLHRDLRIPFAFELHIIFQSSFLRLRKVSFLMCRFSSTRSSDPYLSKSFHLKDMWVIHDKPIPWILQLSIDNFTVEVLDLCKQKELSICRIHDLIYFGQLNKRLCLQEHWYCNVLLKPFNQQFVIELKDILLGLLLWTSYR